MERLKIFIDTDIGSDIDDTWAIVYALCRDIFDVVGICVTGRLPAYRAAIVCRILRELGREDIPVYTGVCTHGEEIMPQARWAGEEYRIAGDIRDSFEEIVRKHGGLHIVGLAPNSTLAALRDVIADRHIPVTAMAGSVRKGYFGADTPVPECNVVTDLKASRHFYERAPRYSMIPLDACGEIAISGKEYAAVKESSSDAARVVMENYRLWDETYVGGARKADVGVRSTILYDLAPLWYLEFPEAFTVERLRIGIAENGVMREDEKGAEMNVATRLLAARELEALTAHTLARGRKHGD